MADEQSRRFHFFRRPAGGDIHGAVPRCEEGLSRCYRFEVEVVAETADLNLAAVLGGASGADGEPARRGCRSRDPAEFEQLHQMDNYVFYRAVIVPRLWWLGLTHHNQVFLNQTVPQILETCLKDGGLTELDFELRLQREYPEWEYVCQYGEKVIWRVRVALDGAGGDLLLLRAGRRGGTR